MRLQESRDGTGVVAAPRTETATRTERPRGRDGLAACRLALSGQNSSD